MKRRELVQFAASAAVLLPAARVEALAQESSFVRLPDMFDDFPRLALLEAIAPVVLPQSLGRRTVRLIVERFLAWLAGYRADVVRDHGYGHPEIRRTPKSPYDRYAEDLAALQGAARERGVAFARLPADAKRALVEEALRAAGVETLPSRPNGKHIVSDLMAFYFRSSEANDVCYRAAVGASKCRPLSVIAARPKPLA